MASLKVTLQKQNEYADGYPLIIRAFVGKKTIQFSMGVRLHPHQLRADGKVVKHNDAMEINKAITDSMRIIESVFAEYGDAVHAMSTAEIKLAVSNKTKRTTHVQESSHTLLSCFQELMKTKVALSTYKSYQYTIDTIRNYCVYCNVDFPSFNDINHGWLLSLHHYLTHVRGLKANTSAITFKCLKAVYNYAIANEYTTKYPFKKF